MCANLLTGQWGVQAVAVVQRAMRQADPAEVMAELGFGQVDLVSSFAVSMSGVHVSPTCMVLRSCHYCCC